MRFYKLLLGSIKHNFLCSVFCVHELTVYCCFIFCCCCCFLFAAAVSLFLLQGRSTEKVLLHHMQQAGALEDFFTIMKCFWTTCEACTQQFAWLLKRLVFAEVGDLSSWQKNYELLQSNNCLLGCERVMETQAEFHFSWVYTFSAMLSSLRN